MPVTISNQRLGPVGQYSSKHPRTRDVYHPCRQYGSVAMGACPEQVPPPLLACQATDNSLLLHETAFCLTTEGSLPITALLYGFEFSYLSGIGRQERFGSGRKRLSRTFPCFSDDMILFAGIFLYFGGSSEYLWYVPVEKFVDRYRLKLHFPISGYLSNGLANLWKAVTHDLTGVLKPFVEFLTMYEVF